MPGTDYVLRNQAYVRQQAAEPTPAKAADTASSSASFSFGDLLDIVNPLQHIPVVSTIYRHLTGDKIGTPEKIAGDTLYGGLTGFLCSVGDAIFTEVTGKSVGDTVYASLIGDDTQPATGVASNDYTPPEAATQTFAMMDPTPPPATPMQAAAAYRASGRLLSAY